MPLYPCGGLAEVEEMAEGEAFHAVLDEGGMDGICGRGAVCRVGLA